MLASVDLIARTTPDGAHRYLLPIAIGGGGRAQEVNVMLDTGSSFLMVSDVARGACGDNEPATYGSCYNASASVTGVALGLVHHTRKIAPGQNATIEDARGGSALRGTARFNRVLNLMTEDEGAKAGVANHRYYFRIGDMESNLAPPSSDINRWFEKASVLIPNGEEVGAIREWKWPDAFDGVTAQQAAQVRATIDRMAEPPRADIRSSLWVGQVVADVLGLDLDSPADKAKAKALLSGWIKSDVLRITEGRDARAGRAVQVVVSGSNNPLTTSGDA